ncbi:hypothetical protein EJB05_35174, partial [Eragrostis curvula]
MEPPFVWKLLGVGCHRKRKLELLSIILLVTSLLPFSASDLQGDVLYDMKLKLEATGSNRLSDWTVTDVPGCLFSYVTCDINNNVVEVKLASMGFTGVLSPRIGELEYLSALSMPGNKITGGIPDQFGNLSRLTRLDLEGNLLAGGIPTTLGRLSNLQSLLLSQNNLSGSIPDTLASISSLTDIQLADNNLSGQVPIHLVNKGSFFHSFSGNNNLTCGANVHYSCASSLPSQGLSRGSKIGIVIGTVGGVLGLLIMGALFMLLKGWRISHLCEFFANVLGTLPSGYNRRTTFGQLRKFAFQELDITTDNFSERNVLGQGGFGKIYKGTLPDGTTIAIKRLNDCRSPVGEATFLREVELISVAVHRNLLRLIGFCTTETERLLVYPFMRNLSVAYHLREFKPGEPILDWSARKRVARGTAYGLEYLHEHCDPKIIHRDVKAHNVLLDEDFEPVIGDFGLARLVDIRTTSVTTKVCGTVGHIAPEYWTTGKASERTDIYGYGMMVLELVTGKRVVDLPAGEEGLVLDHFKRLQREGNLGTIVDCNLNSNYDEQEVEMMIQIALLCTEQYPKDRPSMSEVVRLLDGEGLAERWEECQQAVRSREENLWMPQRYDCGQESRYVQEAIELSDGR